MDNSQPALDGSFPSPSPDVFLPTPKKTLWQKLSRQQKMSLFIIAGMALILPLSYGVSLLQTRLGSRAFTPSGTVSINVLSSTTPVLGLPYSFVVTASDTAATDPSQLIVSVSGLPVDAVSSNPKQCLTMTTPPTVTATPTTFVYTPTPTIFIDRPTTTPTIRIATPTPTTGVKVLAATTTPTPTSGTTQAVCNGAQTSPQCLGRGVGQIIQQTSTSTMICVYGGMDSTGKINCNIVYGDSRPSTTPTPNTAYTCTNVPGQYCDVTNGFQPPCAGSNMLRASGSCPTNQVCCAPRTVITSTPTITPKPPVIDTKCGVNSFSVGQACTGAPTTQTLYKSALYVCYNGMSGTVDLGKCATSDELRNQANISCSSACSNPTPTPTPIVAKSIQCTYTTRFTKFATVPLTVTAVNTTSNTGASKNLSLYVMDVVPPSVTPTPTTTMACNISAQCPNGYVCQPSTTPANPGRCVPSVTPTPTIRISTPTPTPTKINQLPVISSVSLPAGMVGRTYSGAVSALDPDKSDVIDLFISNLPFGLSQSCAKSTVSNAITCKIGGTPLRSGSFGIIITARDNRGGISSKNYTLLINGPIAPTRVVTPIRITVTPPRAF